MKLTLAFPSQRRVMRRLRDIAREREVQETYLYVREQLIRQGFLSRDEIGFLREMDNL